MAGSRGNAEGGDVAAAAAVRVLVFPRFAPVVVVVVAIQLVVVVVVITLSMHFNMLAVCPSLASAVPSPLFPSACPCAVKLGHWRWHINAYCGRVCVCGWRGGEGCTQPTPHYNLS